MPRKKNDRKGKTHPKAKGLPPQQNRQRFNPASNRDSSPFARSHGYTLAEEARNTASNSRGSRGRDARLRYQPVTFISAGFMDPLKDFEIPEQTTSSLQVRAAVSSFDMSGDLVLNTPGSAEPPAQLPDINRVAHHRPAQPQDKHLDGRLDVGSDSSEEVILFKGRNPARQQQKSSPPKPIGDSNESIDAAIPYRVNLELRLVKKTPNIAVNPDSVSQVDELDFISSNTTHRKRQSSLKPCPHTNSDEDDDETAVIADYIANMQNDFNDDDNEGDIGNPGLGPHSFNIFRDLGGTDSDAIPSQSSSGDESGDELGDEEEEEVGERRQLESDVEPSARSIAKQGGPGFDNGDLLLFDDADPDDGWVAARSMPRRKMKRGSRKSKVFHGDSQFPSATEVAEAFDELDLMDMQSSRLQRSKKGPILFGLSDSELEDALNAAIKKDRLKKTDKKKARDELRSQGLLRRNGDPHDLRIKYRGGMSLDDLADEIEAFIIGTREQLILPPFDKGARKIIHTIANTFNIKSKSAGIGTGRYPVLYRSKATLSYDQGLFERAFSRLRRTWFPRVDVNEKVVQEARVLKRAETRSGKPRAGKSSIVLREGDIVGQHASEIGEENKGRAMLEKMGWSKGMSLGTVETKGIIVPLTHVIKKTKAGLGDI